MNFNYLTNPTSQYQQQQQAQAQYQAQLQAHQQAQYQAHLQTQYRQQHYAPQDPRFQHRPQPAQMTLQQQQYYQQQAREAQIRQVQMLEQQNPPDHILYVDPSQPQCENSIKLVQSVPTVLIVDITNPEMLAKYPLPSNIEYMPTILKLGDDPFFQSASMCEQYLKRRYRPKVMGQLKFLDSRNPVSGMLRLDPNNIENQQPIETVDQQGLDSVYTVFPNFGEEQDFDKALKKSNAFIDQIELRVKTHPLQLPKQINEKDDFQDPSLNHRVNSELTRRQNDVSQTQHRPNVAQKSTQEIA